MVGYSIIIPIPSLRRPRLLHVHHHRCRCHRRLLLHQHGQGCRAPRSIPLSRAAIYDSAVSYIFWKQAPPSRRRLLAENLNGVRSRPQVDHLDLHRRHDHLRFRRHPHPKLSSPKKADKKAGNKKDEEAELRSCRRARSTVNGRRRKRRAPSSCGSSTTGISVLGTVARGFESVPRRSRVQISNFEDHENVRACALRAELT